MLVQFAHRPLDPRLFLTFEEDESASGKLASVSVVLGLRFANQEARDFFVRAQQSIPIADQNLKVKVHAELEKLVTIHIGVADKVSELGDLLQRAQLLLSALAKRYPQTARYATDLRVLPRMLIIFRKRDAIQSEQTDVIGRPISAEINIKNGEGQLRLDFAFKSKASAFMSESSNLFAGAQHVSPDMQNILVPVQVKQFGHGNYYVAEAALEAIFAGLYKRYNFEQNLSIKVFGQCLPPTILKVHFEVYCHEDNRPAEGSIVLRFEALSKAKHFLSAESALCKQLFGDKECNIEVFETYCTNSDGKRYCYDWVQIKIPLRLQEKNEKFSFDATQKNKVLLLLAEKYGYQTGAHKIRHFVQEAEVQNQSQVTPRYPSRPTMHRFKIAMAMGLAVAAIAMFASQSWALLLAYALGTALLSYLGLHIRAGFHTYKCCKLLNHIKAKKQHVLWNADNVELKHFNRLLSERSSFFGEHFVDGRITNFLTEQQFTAYRHGLQAGRSYVSYFKSWVRPGDWREFGAYAVGMYTAVRRPLPNPRGPHH